MAAMYSLKYLHLKHRALEMPLQDGNLHNPPLPLVFIRLCSRLCHGHVISFYIYIFKMRFACGI